MKKSIYGVWTLAHFIDNDLAWPLVINYDNFGTGSIDAVASFAAKYIPNASIFWFNGHAFLTTASLRDNLKWLERSIYTRGTK